MVGTAGGSIPVEFASAVSLKFTCVHFYGSSLLNLSKFVVANDSTYSRFALGNMPYSLASKKGDRGQNFDFLRNQIAGLGAGFQECLPFRVRLQFGAPVTAVGGILIDPDVDIRIYIPGLCCRTHRKTAPAGHDGLINAAKPYLTSPITRNRLSKQRRKFVLSTFTHRYRTWAANLLRQQ